MRCVPEFVRSLRGDTSQQGDSSLSYREVFVNAGPQRQAFVGNGIRSAKYSLLSFVPRFLLEVFSRVAYLYFAIQAALCYWPAVSPFDPWGSTAALAFVVGVSAISELWQDGRRHRADYLINNRMTRVMHANGSFRTVAWRDVGIGDVVMVLDGEECPADLVCLFAALPERVCYIQTTNLGAHMCVERVLQTTHTAE